MIYYDRDKTRNISDNQRNQRLKNYAEKIGLKIDGKSNLEGDLPFNENGNKYYHAPFYHGVKNEICYYHNTIFGKGYEKNKKFKILQEKR